MTIADIALRLDGMPQETIDLIDNAMPSAVRMIALVNEAQPLIDQALALFAKAQPLVAQANVELKTLMPAALAVRAFLQTQQATPTAAEQPNVGV